MTLNVLEPPKRGFLIFFVIFDCRSVNCDELDRDSQTTHEQELL